MCDMKSIDLQKLQESLKIYFKLLIKSKNSNKRDKCRLLICTKQKSNVELNEALQGNLNLSM